MKTRVINPIRWSIETAKERRASRPCGAEAATFSGGYCQLLRVLNSRA